MRRALALTPFLLLLAACDSAGPDAPGGVSAGEAEALDDAAEMLDERRLPPEALPPEAAPPEITSTELTGDTGGESRQ